jgi:hypothetical protein
MGNLWFPLQEKKFKQKGLLLLSWEYDFTTMSRKYKLRINNGCDDSNLGEDLQNFQLIIQNEKQANLSMVSLSTCFSWWLNK